MSRLSASASLHAPREWRAGQLALIARLIERNYLLVALKRMLRELDGA